MAASGRIAIGFRAVIGAPSSAEEALSFLTMFIAGDATVEVEAVLTVAARAAAAVIVEAAVAAARGTRDTLATRPAARLALARR